MYSFRADGGIVPGEYLHHLLLSVDDSKHGQGALALFTLLHLFRRCCVVERCLAVCLRLRASLRPVVPCFVRVRSLAGYCTAILVAPV